MGDTSTEKTESPSSKQSGSEFWKGIKSEFRKIIWPDRSTLTKQSIAVIVVSIITGALIAMLNNAAEWVEAAEFNPKDNY